MMHVAMQSLTTVATTSSGAQISCHTLLQTLRRQLQYRLLGLRYVRDSHRRFIESNLASYQTTGLMESVISITLCAPLNSRQGQPATIHAVGSDLLGFSFLSSGKPSRQQLPYQQRPALRYIHTQILHTKENHYETTHFRNQPVLRY